MSITESDIRMQKDDVLHPRGECEVGCYLCAQEIEAICDECGEIRIGDDRVKNGMKCRFCAYGG